MTSKRINFFDGFTSETTPTTSIPFGPAGADGDITWQGDWVSGVYTVNQAVHYSDGNSYVCIVNTTSNQVPTDSGYWDILAKGGVSYGSIVSVSASMTIVGAVIYLVDTSASVTLTLPTPSDGLFVKIKDSTGDAETNPIMISPSNSENIEGNNEIFSMYARMGCIELVSNGTDWFII